LLAAAGEARAATYHVGPGREYEHLRDVAHELEPGDVVEVDGSAVYDGDIEFENSGTAEDKIVIRGVRVNGVRPTLKGGEFLVQLDGDHYVFEGFEITGAQRECIHVAANDITVRDSVIHDCPTFGILATDEGSGSQTYEHLEVFNNGDSEKHHQMYLTTDEEMHPGSTVRVQHCYIHDGLGGNNLKSRAERNEIYYNWIEGAAYHTLDLIGPDGADEALQREDSDVVGNVLISSSPWYVARLGGDGTGETLGRYRFANNTVLVGAETRTVFYLQDGVESLEMSNNVVARWGGDQDIKLVSDGSASWSQGVPLIGGISNWVGEGFVNMPPALVKTVQGEDPGFVDVSSMDLRPSDKSPLIDAGMKSEGGLASFSIPSPLVSPLFSPPQRSFVPVGEEAPRVFLGAPDIGAFEGGTSNGDTTITKTGEPPSGGGCSQSRTPVRSAGAIWVMLCAAGLATRRRGRPCRSAVGLGVR